MIELNSKKRPKIEPVDHAAYLAAKARWDSISKPIDGLGDFEELVCRLAAIQGTGRPTCKKPALLVMCADNGVVQEGVTQCDSSVTLSVAKALARNKSTVSMLARSCGVKVIPYDVGIDTDEKVRGLRVAKVCRGTKNFMHSFALEPEQVMRLLANGTEIALRHGKRSDVLALGEMGIGNTTTATACLCAFLDLDPDEIVGRGAGLDDAGLERKKEVVHCGLAALKELGDRGVVDLTTPYGLACAIMCYFGGCDIVTMVGICIACAIYKKPLIVDGAITAVAALLAEAIAPGVKNYLIASHQGREKTLGIALKVLGLKPYLLGNMALGEGTGAVMTVPLIRAALELYNYGMRFDDLKIKKYKRFKK